MKKCTVCERTYPDEKLSFCTACGGALAVENEADEPAYDPLKTMLATPKPSIEELEKPPAEPIEIAEADQLAEPLVNPSWEAIGANVDQPATGQEPSRALAIGAMACGLISLFCGLTILGPVGLILGFVALRKEKADPAQYGGRTFALVGIATGVLGTLLTIGLVVGVLFYFVMGIQ